MTGPAYHGWTHRPKSEGGTDPIPGLSAGFTPLWATAQMFNKTIADAGDTYDLLFDKLFSNSATAFEAANVGTGEYEYVQINEPGFYLYWSQLYASSVLPDDSWAEPAFDLNGSRAAMVGNLSIPDVSPHWQTILSTIQFNAATRPAALATLIAFHYDPDSGATDIDAQDPLMVGLGFAKSGGAASYNLGAQLLIVRLADVGYTDLSPP